MWQPRGLKRHPAEETATDPDRDILLSKYPTQERAKMKGDSKGDYVAANTGQDDIGYSAGEYGPDMIQSRPTNFLERLEEREKKRFNTQVLSFLYDNFISGWNAGLLRALMLILCAFILNTVAYATLYRYNDVSQGTGTFLEGSCTYIRDANIGVRLGLNIISTMVLSASTFAMQGVTAPTRQEVDKAHQQGKWLEIGAHSMRNLPYVKKTNLWIWLILSITSIPLHLMFNAVFFITRETNQYAVAVVSDSIFDDTTFAPTSENSSPTKFERFNPTNCRLSIDYCYDNANDTIVIDLIKNATNTGNISNGNGRPGAPRYVKLDAVECRKTYSQSFVSHHGDVLVVSSTQNASNPVLWTRYPQRNIDLDQEGTHLDPYHWICHDAMTRGDTDAERCNRDIAAGLERYGEWSVYGNTVEYCLARELDEDKCKLQFNVFLMLAVVVFTFIKTAVIALLVFWIRPSKFALRTVGDAISSYLQQPDPSTRNMCLVTSKQIRKEGINGDYAPQTYTGMRPRWYTGANTIEFFSTIGVTGLYILMLSVALFFAIDGAHGAAFHNGLGTPDIQSLARVRSDDTGSSGIVPVLLVANIPQLGFSFLNIVYTNICGKLLAARQFDTFAVRRETLRVSGRPRGKQRGNHFFWLPAKYAIPLVLCNAGLHYLCSTSLFMVRIDGVGPEGQVDEVDRIARLGYSTAGIVSLIGLSAVLMITFTTLASLKRLNTNLGETSMSVIISAACHLRRPESYPWLNEVQWGDVSGHVEEANEGQGGGIRHIAITSGKADPPIKGELYQ